MNFREHPVLFISIDIAILCVIIGSIFIITTRTMQDAVLQSQPQSQPNHSNQTTPKTSSISIKEFPTESILPSTAAVDITGVFPHIVDDSASPAIFDLNETIIEAVHTELKNFVDENTLDDDGLPRIQISENPSERTIIKSAFTSASTSSPFISILMRYGWSTANSGHPNFYERSLTYDLKKNSIIHIQDFFKTEAYTTFLSHYTREKILEQFIPINSILFEDGVSPNTKNFENFLIIDGQLVIHFTANQTTSFVDGAFDIAIPRDQMEELLSDYGKIILSK